MDYPPFDEQSSIGAAGRPAMSQQTPSVPSPSPPAGARSTRLALAAAIGAAAAALALHLACGNRYGVFRDELYFLACGRHLAWGYVDQPPLIAWEARLAAALLGTSPLGLRLLPYLTHAATVLATALLARRLGGGTFAVALAAVAALIAPSLLGASHLLTMNAADPLLWTALALAVLRATEGEARRGWLAAGAIAGAGLLNKYSMAFWTLALGAGLLSTRARRALASRWLLLAVLLAAAIALPNAAWQARHGFPMLELLRSGQAHKNAPFGWGAFLLETVLEQSPVALPLWLGGLAWLLRGRDPGRPWLGIAFLAVAAEVTLLRGKPYYLGPAFPVLLAAGGCAAEEWSRSAAARSAAAVALLAGGAAIAPLAIPLLPPTDLVRWQGTLGVRPSLMEQHELGPLPQVFADMLGWPEMVESVARVWKALPAEVRAHAVVYAQNYGEAAAIDLYGPARGLPPAYSGHNSYWLWGPPPENTRAVLVVGGRAEDHRRSFERVEQVGETPDSPWSMPYERKRPIWLLAGPRVPFTTLWAAVRLYI
jgi:4-amino-4-deoxy-L-arabinose transferase-like glycosyltransferase